VRLEKCRSCSAWIFWAKNEKSGKAMPIDHAPVAGGNLVVSDTAAGVFVKHDTAPDVPGLKYVSHFVTCPDRLKWRKR
jgi:hypothetical protein